MLPLAHLCRTLQHRGECVAVGCLPPLGAIERVMREARLGQG